MNRSVFNDPKSKDLGQKTVGGGLSTVFMQVSTTVVNMGGLMVLARIIAPEDFGLIAKVAALTGLVRLIGDMGLTVATVQSETIDSKQLSALFWVNIIVSSAIGTIIALCAPLIAWFYNDTRVIWVAVALGLNAVTAGMGVQHLAILRRQMHFFTIAFNQIVASVVGVIVAIATARWLGYWALLLQVLCTTTSITVGAWFCSGWRPGFQLTKTGIRNHLKVGANFTVSNFMNYFTRNGDNVLIAKFWGEQALAYYAKAYSLLLMPMRQIAGPMSQVAVPALSRLQSNPEGYREFFRKGVSISMIMQIPITVFAAVAGAEIVLTVLGPKWVASIPIFYALVPNLLASATSPATQWVFLSRGDTARLVKMVAVTSICVLIGFAVGLPYGPVGVAWAFSIVTCVARIPGILYCFRPSPVTASDFFPLMIPPTICSVIAAAACYLAGLAFPNHPAWAVLIVKFVVFSICYIALISMTQAGRDLLLRLQRFSKLNVKNW